MTLGDQAARAAISHNLGETLFVEAGAGSGKTRSLVDRVVSIVLRDHVPLTGVAAVTFTDKAASELGHRLRLRFAAESGDPAARQELDDLDTAAIGTLHAFAQRLLTEHPIEAGLPPLIEVRDEVASGVQADARWTALRAALLDDPDLTDTLTLAIAGGVRLDDLRALAATLNANWDLLETRVLPVPVLAWPMRMGSPFAARVTPGRASDPAARAAAPPTAPTSTARRERDAAGSVAARSAICSGPGTVS